MRLNVPLLPIVAEVRWRVLGPPRFSMLGLMLAVGVMAVFFSLCAYLGRVNRAMAYHREQGRIASLNRFPYRSLTPQAGPTPNVNWHAAMASEYQDTFMRLDLIVFLFLLAIVGICVCALVGRLLNVIARRSVAASARGG